MTKEQGAWIREEAARLGTMKRQIKELCMVYQVEEKQRLARKHGKPINAYYHLAYEEWAAIHDAR